MSCSGSLKKGRFGYQWQAALALVGPIYDTSVESTIFAGIHTSAKLIEIQQKCLSKIHGLCDLGSHMESNDTLHGSELVPHSVLGPKN